MLKHLLVVLTSLVLLSVFGCIPKDDAEASCSVDDDCDVEAGEYCVEGRCLDADALGRFTRFGSSLGRDCQTDDARFTIQLR